MDYTERGEEAGMANDIVITVNRKHHQVTAAPDTPLLYVLRNELGLQSPQFGCGVVLINHPGEPAVGAGEPSTVTTAAAIATAIFAATGARVREIPFTSKRVKAAMGQV
jgi:aerobic-type carbon monoxide dehydrogenase small subunit (CoxS/CutS family)